MTTALPSGLSLLFCFVLGLSSICFVLCTWAAFRAIFGFAKELPFKIAYVQHHTCGTRQKRTNRVCIYIYIHISKYVGELFRAVWDPWLLRNSKRRIWHSCPQNFERYIQILNPRSKIFLGLLGAILDPWSRIYLSARACLCSVSKIP